MAHEIGGVEIPFLQGIATEAGTEGAPWLSTMANEYSVALSRYCGSIWTRLAPGEPIVRKIHYHEPKDGMEFRTVDMPALFIDVAGVPQNIRETDSNVLLKFLVDMWWVPHPSQVTHREARANFWAAVHSAVMLTTVPRDFSLDTDTGEWGAPLINKCGFRELMIVNAGKDPLKVEASGLPGEIESYKWSFEVSMDASWDVTTGPVVPAKAHNIYHEGSLSENNPLLTSILPKPSP